MKTAGIRKRFSIVVVLAIALLSGCTFTHTINPKPRTEALLPTTTSPLHAGVYYSPQFANHEYVRAGLGSHIWKVRIGAASTRLFSDILPRAFRKVSRLETLSTDELRAKGVDLVIAPALEHFDFRMGMDPDRERYSVSYRITLYTNRGVPFTSWVVKGNGKSDTIMWTITSLVEDDMNDAAAQFLREFEKSAGFALRIVGNKSGGQTGRPDLNDVVISAKLAILPGLEPKLAGMLKEAGVVIVQVAARSRSENTWVMRASDMRLRLNNGELIEPSTLDDALSALERPSHAGAAIGGIHGVGLEIFLRQFKQAKREKLFRDGTLELFGDRTLKKENEETGIVLFCVPKGMKIADTATLTAWVVDQFSAEGDLVEFAISLAP